MDRSGILPRPGSMGGPHTRGRPSGLGLNVSMKVLENEINFLAACFTVMILVITLCLTVYSVTLDPRVNAMQWCNSDNQVECVRVIFGEPKSSPHP